MNNKDELERKRADVLKAYEQCKRDQEMYAQQLKDMAPAAPEGPAAASPITEVIEGEKEDLNVIAELYKQKFGADSDYQEPKMNDDGSMTLSFPDEKSAMDFAENIAKKGIPFIMQNGNGKVLGYSTGDGVLNKNEDGKSFDDVRSELDAAKNRPGM